MVPGLGWFSRPTSWSPQLLLSCARCAGPACLAVAPQWVTMRTWHKHTGRCLSRHLCVASPTPAQVPTRVPTPLLTSAAPRTLNLPKQAPPERVECVFLVCEQSFGQMNFSRAHGRANLSRSWGLAGRGWGGQASSLLLLLLLPPQEGGRARGSEGSERALSGLCPSVCPG